MLSIWVACDSEDNYHRFVGDTYEIVDLNSNIGKVTGWEDGTPACVDCTFDY